MTTFYRVDGARLTYAEYWRMAPGFLAFALSAGCKLLGTPIRFEFAVPRPDRLFLVEFEEFPEAACRAMEPALESARSAGLRLIFCHRLALPEPSRLGAGAYLLDDTNETGLMIGYGQSGNSRELHLACVSQFTDETLATTTTTKKSMKPTPWQSVERYPGSNARTIYEKHLAHLARLAGQGSIPVPHDPARFDRFVLECELRYVDYHIDRGIFVPMTEEELEALSGRLIEEEF